MTEKIDHIEKLTKDLLKTIGEDPEREGLLKTPKRVGKAWEYFSQGYWETWMISSMRQFSMRIAVK